MAAEYGQFKRAKGAELLAPAGEISTARVALSAGADAVYLGLRSFSARAEATNFSLEELVETARFAHLLGAKVYVCFNTLFKDDETEKLFSLLPKAWNSGADAVLLQDVFLGARIKAAYPDISLHLSTQAGVCNEYGAELAKDCGFSRVVLARETPLKEIAKISKIIGTEAFVQGALCTCFSGQCYLSSFAGNNSGNRGKCKQPCRKRYSIDRDGYREFAYALSVSDLSLGNRVEQLLSAGVCSLKIEGRMRRQEYVAAAVSYYRTLLDGRGDEKEAFSRLKRAYNRGDYTAGLGFGQNADFLSRAVQGHIGEKAGTLSLRGGEYYCKSGYAARTGDCFKALRGGKEAGSAVFARSDGQGFYLRSHDRLKAGDEIRVTTSANDAPQRECARKREITLSLRFKAGETPLIRCGDFTLTGTEVLQKANTAPLSEQALTDCFSRTDGLPLSPVFETIETDGVFLHKSGLNALRREFYELLCAHLTRRTPLQPREIASCEILPTQGTLTAAITDDVRGLVADILIVRPNDTKADLSGGAGKKYLYLPPFFTSDDEARLQDVIPKFDGIYCDGLYGIELARKYRKPLFAGVGCNVTNRYAVQGIKEAGAEHYCLSKELTAKEQSALSAEGAFALTGGALKVMDLCYCVFEKTCSRCDRREWYTLTDEEGRKFPLRRYRAGDGCRFEVFNCVPLAAYNGITSALVDLAGDRRQTLIDEARNLKAVLPLSTGGHTNRSLL